MKKALFFIALLFCLNLVAIGYGAEQPAIYKPGTYEGVAKGRKEGMTVKVVVDKTHIMSIEVVSHHDTKKKVKRCKKTVIENIIKKQNTQVDVVAKASLSSRGIMKATENALQKARIQ